MRSPAVRHSAFPAVVLSLALLLVAAPAARSEEGPVPAPRLDRIDYRSPKALAELGTEVGVGQRSKGIVRQLAQDKADPTKTLTRIARWVDRNLKLDTVMSDRWRGVDQILQDGTLGGAADQAVVIGAFARTAGIPVSWVKTLPARWMIAARSGRARTNASVGKVFLEIFLDGRWRLYDPASARLYEDYVPTVRRLPGGQYAFDKGTDPYLLVLPNRREVWDKQVRGFVAGLDLSSIPWARSRDLLARWRVYIAGKGDAASYARATARAFGYKVERSFNKDWERALAGARGKTLIVTSHRGAPVLPEKYWGAFLPKDYAKLDEAARNPPEGWMLRRLADGTRVILVTASGYGPIELAVSEALEK